MHLWELILLATIAQAARVTNNWAVLVSTSRFWFNYRHMSNTLAMYRTVKRLGIPDSQIILMLPDEVACNPRNAFTGSVYADAAKTVDLYAESIEVDYRGNEVTVENFIRMLTGSNLLPTAPIIQRLIEVVDLGRVDDDMPSTKRLATDANSNIFVYMAGHGGDEFLKFQDTEEISAYDLADAFAQMHAKNRYNEIFFMVDTCQANTMYSKIYSPNILTAGSSAKGENAYSHHADGDIGVAVVDRYTHLALTFLEKMNQKSKSTMADLFATFNPHELNANPGVRTDLYHRPLHDVLLTEFFGGTTGVQLIETAPSVMFTRQMPSSIPSRSIAHLSTMTQDDGNVKHDFSNLVSPSSKIISLVTLLFISIQAFFFSIDRLIDK